jgi:D-alanyl-D-alanine carboxypeptidase
MRRALPLVAVAGLALGAVSMLAMGDAVRAGEEPAPPRAKIAEETAVPTAPGDPVVLVWTPDGLPPGFGAAVANLPEVEQVSEVLGDSVRMASSHGADGSAVEEFRDGWVVALDALAVDPMTYAAFLPKGAGATVEALAPGQAILGATSAQLRRVSVGASIGLDTGEHVRVVAVLDDALVGGAELVVARGSLSGVQTPRFLLVEHRGARAQVEGAIRRLLPAGEAVRFRAPGETPLLRHGDAVLSQAEVKARFGEFAFRPGRGRDIEIDPAWERANIVTADLPLLGRVRCHRAIADEFRAVLADLEQRNLGYLVAADGFSGCYVPRLVDPGGALSRHAWGIAADINWPKNPEGQLGNQDERLISAFTERGFAWGGPWLVPDPAHFEWVGTTTG